MNRNEIAPVTVKPVSYELGARPRPQTMSVLQGLTTKLAEARGEEFTATALRKAEAQPGKDSNESRGGRPQRHNSKR